MLGRRICSRGDTIIEVLIAIAVISVVLVTAYVVTNKNTQSIQDTQERAQAQALVNAQIEALRNNQGIGTSGNCFEGTTETSVCNTFKRSGSGATYTATIQKLDGDSYMVKATWISLSGELSNVTMYYRLVNS